MVLLPHCVIITFLAQKVKTHAGKIYTVHRHLEHCGKVKSQHRNQTTKNTTSKAKSSTMWRFEMLRTPK